MSGPGVPPNLEAETIVSVFVDTASANGGRVALRWRVGEQWSQLTWGEYERQVREVAAGLSRWDLVPGDRVAILAANQPDWHVVDLAVLSLGLVSVPVYPTSSADQVAYILRHSGARLCVVDADQVAKIRLHQGELSDLSDVVVMSKAPDASRCVALAAIRDAGVSVLAADPGIVARHRAALGGSDLATLVYTSGTTGAPKGVMITHANIMATMRSLRSLVGVGPEDRFLSFLPLSHITERCISHFGQITGGAETWFAQSFATVADDMKACRPTLFFAVPRVWEKVRQGIVEEVHHARAPARWLAAGYVGGAVARPHPSRLAAKASAAKHRALMPLVGPVLRRRLGLDRARLMACGAAPVAPELLHWLAAVGLRVAEGYGQTEACMATSFNRPGAIRIGTVGPPVPGVTVRIAPDGEVLARGDNVCAGYWQDDAASADLVDTDGWLHTGDLGTVDPQGYLTVTGRKKDLIITSYGKNVAPEAIEKRLRADRIISQAVVVGDDRPYLTALLTLDNDAVSEWAAREHRTLDLEALTDDPGLQAEVERIVQRVNAERSHPEGIRQWRVLPHELTVAAEELTPTLKVRRGVVAEHYRALIDEMYAPAA